MKEHGVIGVPGSGLLQKSSAAVLTLKLKLKEVVVMTHLQMQLTSYTAMSTIGTHNAGVAIMVAGGVIGKPRNVRKVCTSAVFNRSSKILVAPVMIPLVTESDSDAETCSERECLQCTHSVRETGVIGSPLNGMTTNTRASGSAALKPGSNPSKVAVMTQA